jgi:hypothetical protein
MAFHPAPTAAQEPEPVVQSLKDRGRKLGWSRLDKLRERTREGYGLVLAMSKAGKSRRKKK